MSAPDRHHDFDELFERLAPRVLVLGQRLTGDADMAQETVQETFLAVHRGLPGFRGDAAIETWVYRIAVHAARRQLQRARAGKRRESVYGANAPGRANDETAPAATEDQRAALHRAMSALTADQREAISLLSLREVRGAVAAEILRVPEGTVYSRAFAARAALRKLMERDQLPPASGPDRP